MSYNIKQSNVIALNLTLPKKFNIRKLCDDVDIDVSLESETFEWTFGESSSVGGVIVGETLVVKDVHCTSEWSGNCLDDVIVPLFAQNNGYLHMVNVWEDGEIYELEVERGAWEANLIDLVETVKNKKLTYYL